MENIGAEMKCWDNLYVPSEILKALKEEKFYKPTTIQKEVLLLAIRDRRDILGAAATGTGKTLAFGIPMIARILQDRQQQIALSKELTNKRENENNCEDENAEDVDSSLSGSELECTWKDDDIQPETPIGLDLNFENYSYQEYQHIYGLVLTPTRELAVQVSKHLKKACQFTDLKVVAIFGGMSVEKQERLLKQRPEILVVTPGRFWSFIKDENIHAMSVAKLSVLVIDEADRMAEKGHFREVDNVIQWLKNCSRKVYNKELKCRQTFIFSATLTFASASLNKTSDKINEKDDKISQFVSTFGMCKKPKVIDLSILVKELHKWKIICPTQADKDIRLFWFLFHHKGRFLIFVNSKNGVRRLKSVLTTLGLNPRCLSSDMQEKVRLKSLEMFAKDPNGLMIATDVAARGLDIPRVDFVIHFDMAHTAETYIHRTGRTARAENAGHSIIMLSPSDMKQLRKFSFGLKNSDESSTFCVDEYQDIPLTSDLEDYNEIVEYARKLEGKMNQFKKYKCDKNWFESMAEKAGIDIDDDIKTSLKKKSFSQNELKQMKFEQKEMKQLCDYLKKKQGSYRSPIHEIHPSTMKCSTKTSGYLGKRTIICESNYTKNKKRRQ